MHRLPLRWCMCKRNYLRWHRKILLSSCLIKKCESVSKVRGVFMTVISTPFLDGAFKTGTYDCESTKLKALWHCYSVIDLSEVETETNVTWRISGIFQLTPFLFNFLQIHQQPQDVTILSTTFQPTCLTLIWLPDLFSEKEFYFRWWPINSLQFGLIVSFCVLRQ